MAADPLARANPLGDRVNIGGQEPFHEGLVVQPFMEVVRALRVRRFGRGDDLLHPAPLAESLEHGEGMDDQDPAR